MPTMNREEHRALERYAYCLCLHVRPGTIFIGVINLAESLLCGVLFLVALIYQSNMDTDTHLMYKHSVSGHTRTASHSLAVIVYMASAAVSVMLLYGVVKSRPSYLMPFFWIRLCDFFFSLPTFMATLYANPAYSASSPHWGESGGHHTFSHSSHASSPPGFTDMRKVWPAGGHGGAPSLLVATCVILFKGYFLCVVWKCYRYLKMREMILPLQLSGYPISGGHHHHHHRQGAATSGAGFTDLVLSPGFMRPPIPVVPPVVTVSMSPPDYETATKGNCGISAGAPPDYETAIRSQQDLKLNTPNSFVSNNLSNGPSTSSSSIDIERDNKCDVEAGAAADADATSCDNDLSNAATEKYDVEENKRNEASNTSMNFVVVEPSSVTIEEVSNKNNTDSQK